MSMEVIKEKKMEKVQFKCSNFPCFLKASNSSNENKYII